MCREVFVLHICWIFGCFSTQIAERSEQKVREILNLQPNVSPPPRGQHPRCHCSSFPHRLLHFFVVVVFCGAQSSRSPNPLRCPRRIFKLNNQVLSASVQLPACLEVRCHSQSVFQLSPLPIPYNKSFINLSLSLTPRSTSVIF